MNQKVINCPHCGCVLPKEFWHEKNQGETAVKCPRCGSQRVWKYSHRFIKDGTKIRRYYCNKCGRKFS